MWFMWYCLLELRMCHANYNSAFVILARILIVKWWMRRAGCVKSTKVVQVHIRRSQIFQYLVLILIWMELMLESGRDTHLISPTDAQFRKQDIFESLKNQDVIYYMHRLTICDSRWYSSNQVKPILKRGFQNGNGQTTTNNAPYLSLQSEKIHLLIKITATADGSSWCI